MDRETVPVATVIDELEAAQELVATRDELLRTAVRCIEGANPRYDWVGIYLLEEDTLVLHSYVGRPTEHAEIPVGVGVCGAAIAEGRDMNVPDVRAIENYLSGLALGGSRPLPELFQAAGLTFDLGEKTMRNLFDAVEAELSNLPL